MTTISTVEQLIEARPDICEPAREWLADISLDNYLDILEKTDPV